jgi:ATP-binding cassette, subfamily C (CFTR/MRP), member 1
MQHSQEHGSRTNSSGSPTTTGGTVTPAGNMDSGDDLWKDAELTATVTEKLQRKGSFQKARIAHTPSFNVHSAGLTKEHQEQGSVKRNVYNQYIYAASKIGFILYLCTVAAQQATSVLASLTLRYWGEHNQELGDNSGMFKYLLAYGLFSLSSNILGAIAVIIIWVYCALRSARYLHDSVRSHTRFFFFGRDSNLND